MNYAPPLDVKSTKVVLFCFKYSHLSLLTKGRREGQRQGGRKKETESSPKVYCSAGYFNYILKE